VEVTKHGAKLAQTMGMALKQRSKFTVPYRWLVMTADKDKE
jgi:hypothetical protein